MSNILKQDIVFKDYFKNYARFADFINGTLYKGQQIIDMYHLSLDDTDVSTVLEGILDTVERRKDVVMRYEDHYRSCMIGIENQSSIDRDMIVRVLTYDSLQYTQQVKSDGIKVLPIISIVVYTGNRRWKSPVYLLGEFDIPEEDKEYFNDWKLLVFDIKELDEELFVLEENKMLVECTRLILKKGRNPEVLKGMVIPKEVALVVASLVEDKTLFENIKIEEKEEINMCQSLIDLRNDGIEEGLLQGEMIGMQKGEIIGVQKTLTKTLIQQLTLKLGVISKELILEIKKSDEDKLNELVIRIFDVNNEEDIYRILN